MKNKQIHPFKLPVEWPNIFLSHLESKGDEISSHDILAVQKAVLYDIARKLEYSDHGSYVLTDILSKNNIKEKDQPTFLTVIK